MTYTINEFLQKDKELDWSHTTTEALDVFNKLKSELVEPPVLALTQP